MNKKGIGAGVFLLGLGIIWLLVNLNILELNIFGALFKLWPLLFIVVGVSIIFKNNPVVKALSWLSFIVVILSYGTYYKNDSPFKNRHSENIQITEESGDSRASVISESMRTGLKTGSLELDVAGLGLKLASGNDRLIEATSNDKLWDHKINYSNDNENVSIKLEGGRSSILNQKSKDYEIKLNKDILWDISLDTGATGGTLDLSDLKVNRLEIDSGAVSYRIILGGNIPTMDVKLDSGASNFDIEIPSGDIGVRVNFDGGLNSTNLNSLGWKKNGSTYESPNYSSAKSKINIDSDMGLGKFNIIMK